MHPSTRRARTLLDQLKDFEVTERDPFAQQWETRQPPERPVVRNIRQQENWAQWDRWCEAHIARALASQPVFTKVQTETMGRVISQLRGQMINKTADVISRIVGEECGKLRDELRREVRKMRRAR